MPILRNKDLSLEKHVAKERADTAVQNLRDYRKEVQNELAR